MCAKYRDATAPAAWTFDTHQYGHMVLCCCLAYFLGVIEAGASQKSPWSLNVEEFVRSSNMWKRIFL